MSDQEKPPERKNWTVSGDQTGIRLDGFARACLPHISRREIDKAIREKSFWINHRPGKKGDRLVAGDVLAWRGPDSWLSPRPLAEERLTVPIVYEDSDLLVVDKPAGMATHGFSGRDTDTLANFLVACFPALADVGKSRWEPGLVHRLDRDTSGLVLVAKGQESFNNLRRQFSRGLVKKRYRALVWGATAPEGTLSQPLIHDPADRRRMKPAAAADAPQRRGRIWPALTRFQTLTGGAEVSLLEIEMDTGVTHQIRVHLSAIGHPIVGDRLYGDPGSESFGLERHFLHASYLSFHHPRDGRETRIESALAPELRAVLQRLKLDA